MEYHSLKAVAVVVAVVVVVAVATNKIAVPQSGKVKRSTSFLTGVVVVVVVVIVVVVVVEVVDFG